MGSSNAIAERLQRLDSQWSSFIDDPAARCLHWLIEPDEWRMLDLFFSVEETDAAFFVVDVPFADGGTHGLRLRNWLIEKVREVEPQLVEAGAQIGWAPPAVPAGGDDVDAFIAAAESLWEHHQPHFETLVPVLVPESVSSKEGWTEWLDRLLSRPTQPLRFVMVDYVEAPTLARVATTHAATVRTVPAALDMPGAYVDLSKAAGGLDAPPGMFRQAFVHMSNALSDGDEAAAEEQAKVAKDVARQEGWTHLEFAVDFAQGSGHLGKGEPTAAIASYRAAEHSANRAHAAGEEFGLGLVLKAKLGQGAACVAAESYDLGANVYFDAVAIARECGDLRSELDCLRMAAYCHERANRPKDAWKRGIEAVEVGQRMNEEERGSSTLAHAGAGLLRVCKMRGFGGRERIVDTNMRSLLGDDWQPR